MPLKGKILNILTVYYKHLKSKYIMVYVNNSTQHNQWLTGGGVICLITWHMQIQGTSVGSKCTVNFCKYKKRFSDFYILIMS